MGPPELLVDEVMNLDPVYGYIFEYDPTNGWYWASVFIIGRSMKKKGFSVLGMVAVAAMLTACGGGEGAGESQPNVSAPTSTSTAAILSYLDTTNVASTGFPFNGQFAGVTKRWNLPIPVKTNGEARAVPAMDAIEAKLGYTVFDRTSIATVADADITRGLVFSKGTSYLPAGANPQSYCANVARAPYEGGWPSNFLQAPGTISAKLYVNLDNPQCTASGDITIHELGHALGFGAHFNAFGGEAPITADFWPVLATLYGNPVGTTKAGIVMKQAN